MNIPLVDLKAQYLQIKQEISQSIDAALEGMNLFLGENVQRFEEEFAGYCGAKFGIGVGSGTEALHLALLALGVEAGSEVITVSHTFIATVEAISHVGAKPVFVDIDPKTYTMDISQVERKISGKTKAIVPVHIYGQAVDMKELQELSCKYGVSIIEDACQAHGSEYEGNRVGSLGDAGCFSFYFSKNLGAYGEAGMVVTNNEEIAKKIRLLRNHGADGKHVHTLIGYNSRMDELQAAVLRVKLRRLDQWNQQRQENAYLYNKLLEASEVVTPYEADYGRHVYHLYVIRSKNRDALRQNLNTMSIETGIHYPIPVHLQPVYQMYENLNGELPVTERLVKEILSLPMYPELSTPQIQHISEAVIISSYSNLKE